MGKKYRTEREGSLLRIIALKDFSNITNVKKGDRGGLIEKEENLDQEGDCWVYENARVYGNAMVYGSARISGNAQVYGGACIYGHASVFGNARVCGNIVMGCSTVCGNVKLWSTELSYVFTPKSNTKDYVILAIRPETKLEFCMFSSNLVIDPAKTALPISGQNYIRNIKTIRQLYGKEI